MSRWIDRIQRLSTQEKRVLKCGDKEVIYLQHVTHYHFELGLETAVLFHTPHEARLEVRVINGILLTLPSPLALHWLRSSENCDTYPSPGGIAYPIMRIRPNVIAIHLGLRSATALMRCMKKPLTFTFTHPWPRASIFTD